MPAPANLALRALPDGDLIMQGRNSAQLGVAGALTYEARARLIVTGGKKQSNESSLSVRGADSVIVLIAMATSYRDYQHVDGDPAALNKAALDRAAGRSFDELLSRHQTDHRRLFRRVQLDLGQTPAASRPTDERVRNIDDERRSGTGRALLSIWSLLVDRQLTPGLRSLRICRASGMTCRTRPGAASTPSTSTPR